MTIEMKVSGLMIDPLTNMPIVILKSEAGDRMLPIWIGSFEAQALAMKREGIEVARPMTHDLLEGVIRALKAKVLRAVITDLREGTFYAVLQLDTPQGPVEVDSRPSDAMAVALRTEAPNLVETAVLDKSAALDESRRPEESDARLKRWFESVDPGDYSKYQM